MAPNAEQIVRAFLAALCERDIETGAALLVPDARIVFPGGAARHSIVDIVAGSTQKYQRCEKTYERFDSLADGADDIVYCYGTLHGAFADGRVLSGIRYIDRFVLRDGLIVEHLVWNDAGLAIT